MALSHRLPTDGLNGKIFVLPTMSQVLLAKDTCHLPFILIYLIAWLLKAKVLTAVTLREVKCLDETGPSLGGCRCSPTVFLLGFASLASGAELL